MACVRFGNVAWASGSVLPMWKIQAEKKNAINVTNGEATRFLMSIKQAVNLTLKAAVICQGGETFILKMPSICLNDLAGIFTKKYYPRKKIKIKNVGDRAGDKLHEDLLGLNDHSNKIWASDEMFILVPALPIHNLTIKPRSYIGFKNILSDGGFSSKDHIDVKAVEKIV